jgi:nitroimidazol reductase NimA-like FMN-containing flavoprotein (pyridoxamine 5'-phosphate oxidase superfamily)
MPGMTKQQVIEFLKKPNIAKVAGVRKDGKPFIAPVWYEWEDPFVYVGARKRSRWVDHLRVNPNVSVLIDSSEFPYPKVLLEGEAKILQEDWVEMGRRMSIRYIGKELGLKYLEESLDQPRHLIRVAVKKKTTWICPPESRLQLFPQEAWHPRYYEPGSKWYETYRRQNSKP